jgi:hypothetical protein
MHDYDLDKIADQVKKLYAKSGIWPEYVELPASSYHIHFRGGTEGRQCIMCSDGNSDNLVINLIYRPSNVGCPVIHWSTHVLNSDVLKDKPQPPNLHEKSTCGNCERSTPHQQSYVKDQIRCHKHGVNLNNNNYCDDWMKPLGT